MTHDTYVEIPSSFLDFRDLTLLISETTQFSEGEWERPTSIAHFTRSTEALGQLTTLRTRDSLKIPTIDSNHPSVTLILLIRDGHMDLENIKFFRTMSTLSNISMFLKLVVLNQNVHDLRVEQWFDDWTRLREMCKRSVFSDLQIVHV
jgi:hypothetical protein